MKNLTRCKIGCGIATIIIFTLAFFGGIMIQRFLGLPIFIAITLILLLILLILLRER